MTLRSAFTDRERVVLAAPRPSDFGIPDQYAQAAMAFAELLIEYRQSTAPKHFAGLTITEIRVPFGMAVSFEGEALVIKAGSST